MADQAATAKSSSSSSSSSAVAAGRIIRTGERDEGSGLRRRLLLLVVILAVCGRAAPHPSAPGEGVIVGFASALAPPHRPSASLRRGGSLFPLGSVRDDYPRNDYYARSGGAGGLDDGFEGGFEGGFDEGIGDRDGDWDGGYSPDGGPRGGSGGNPTSRSPSASDPERPFQRRNDAYWSDKRYSAPVDTRRQYSWDDGYQRSYRESKFTRDSQWPQRQKYRGDQGEGPRRFDPYRGMPPARDDGARAVRSSSAHDEGDGIGDEGFVNDPDSVGGGGGYTEDFRRGSSNLQGREIGLRRRMAPFDADAAARRGTGFEGDDGRGNSMEAPRRPVSLRPGYDIGERYTETFRRGSKSGGYRNDYQSAFAGGSPTKGQRPPSWGTQIKHDAPASALPGQGWYGMDQSSSAFGDDGRPNYWKIKEEAEKDFGRFANGAGYRYYDNPQRPPARERGLPSVREGQFGRDASGAKYQYYNRPEDLELRGRARAAGSGEDDGAIGGYAFRAPRPPRRRYDDAGKFEETDERQSPREMPRDRPGWANSSLDPKRPQALLGRMQDGFDERRRRDTIDLGTLSAKSSGTFDERLPSRKVGSIGDGSGEWQRESMSGRARPTPIMGGYADVDSRGGEPYESKLLSKLQQYPPPGRAGRGDGAKKPKGIFDGLKKMVERLASPYAEYGGALGVDRMTGRTSSALDESAKEERRSTKALLAEARARLLADQVVRDVLGGSIQLGKPLSRTASSTTVEGNTRS
ncbi:hypothetical protein ACHAWF_004699 [Thalassiosira exigua]